MKFKVLMLVSSAALASQAANAQINEIEVNDGASATCYGPNGPFPCGFFTQPTVDITVADGTGNASDVTTTATQTTVTATDGTAVSGLNVEATGTALESLDPAIGYAGIGTQVGTSVSTGNVSGQIVGQARDAAGATSELYLDGHATTLRSRGASGEFGFIETNSARTLIGHSADGSNLTTGLRSTAAGNTLVGDTEVLDNFTVLGGTTLNGFDNTGAGITNAGSITGVTAGVISATSTDAVNGSQLYTTNTNVAAAQNTADTALANAATAQGTADTALANAATAQGTADTALANAAAAQGTADTALANAATAQGTADTALANAATAQTTADTAIADAAFAVTTAGAAQTTANAANANASAALAQAANSVQYDSPAHDSVTLNPGGNAVAIHNVAAGIAPTDAVNMAQLTGVANRVTALDSRVASLEDFVQGVDVDLRKLDRMAGRGVAIATALASIPPIDRDQKIGFGMGVGNYDGRTAFSAAIIGRVSNSAQFRINAGTTGNGKVAVGSGLTFGW